MDSYQKLKTIFSRMSQLQYLQRLLMWDEAVMMPEGSGATRAQALATLNRTIKKMLTNKKIAGLLEDAKQIKNLKSWDKMNLQWMNKIYKRTACVPLSLVGAATLASIETEQAWRKYRALNDWQSFLPYLQKSFNYIKEIADRRSQVFGMSSYDVLLDEYAPGFSQQTIDTIFTELKSAIPPLVHSIVEKQNSRSYINPTGPFSIEKQKQLGMTVMMALGFDFRHGRLDVSHHPFCSGGPKDVRITTRYNEQEFISSLMGICHETGHGLYEQGLPDAWLNQPVGRVDSMAMHESQSLLIEMEVCLSPAFFDFIAPFVQEHFGVSDALTSQNLYCCASEVSQSLIRVDADEVTYPLHVILRYELEKALFSGDLNIKDLPDAWNHLMQGYLSISTAGNYKDGVMQDVHWPAGIFGYFPAYTLGRLMAAQFYAAYKQSHPNYAAEIQKGDFNQLKAWLSQNVYQYASSEPTNDLLLRVTKQPLSITAYLNNIKQRYLS